MSKKILKFAVFLLLFPISTGAIPPPEIVNNFSPILAQGVAFFISFIIAGWFFLKKFFKKIFKWKFNIFISLILLLSIFNIFLNFNTTKQEILKAQQVLAKEPDNKNNHDRYFSVTEEGFREIIISLGLDKRDIPEDLSISAGEFKDLILNHSSEINIYDIRMKREYDIGHAKGAVFLDPLRFNKEELIKFIKENQDKKTIFYCQAGFRGKTVTDVLKDRLFESYYVQTGAMFTDENIWEGEYYDYVQSFKTKILTKKEFDKEIKNGATLLDPRDTPEYDKNHLPQAINIPIEELGYDESVIFFNENFNTNDSFIAVCYDKLSCFKAYLVLKDVKKNYANNIIGLYTIDN
jgi:rhodanese-related sulfurtransferase